MSNVACLLRLLPPKKQLLLYSFGDASVIHLEIELALVLHIRKRKIRLFPKDSPEFHL